MIRQWTTTSSQENNEQGQQMMSKKVKRELAVVAAAATMVVVMRCLHVAPMGSKHTTMDSNVSTMKDFVLSTRGLGGLREARWWEEKRSKETKKTHPFQFK